MFVWLDYISFALFPVMFSGKNWHPKVDLVSIKRNKQDRDARELRHKTLIKLMKLGLKETIQIRKLLRD